MSRISVYQSKGIEDLTHVTENVFRFVEVAINDIRQSVSDRFALINQKNEEEIERMKVKNDEFVRGFFDQAKERMLQEQIKKLEQMDLETRNFINVTINDSRAKMRKEVLETAKGEARKALRVPGLIGEHCPYSTYANFMALFEQSTSKFIDESRIQSVSFENRLTENDQRAKQWKKEIEGIMKEMEDMKREDARATSAIF